MSLTNDNFARNIQVVDADTSQTETHKVSALRAKSRTVSAGELKLYGFPSLYKCRSLINEAVGAVFAANEKRYALTNNPARELTGGISGTRQPIDSRLAHDTSALEIEASRYASNSVVMAFLYNMVKASCLIHQELGLFYSQRKGWL